MAREPREAGQAKGLGAARKLGRRFREKYHLSHPFNVRETMEAVADVVELEGGMPLGLDAVVLLDRERPKIIIDGDKPPTRVRFTAAHELGHIAIPWHTGIIRCIPAGEGTYSDPTYQQVEDEANEFASELVFPSDWLGELLSNESNPAEATVAAAKGAKASVHAAAFAVRNALERPAKLLGFGPQANWLFEMRTDGFLAHINVGHVSNLEARKTLRKAGYTVNRVSKGGTNVVSVEPPSEASAREVTETSKEILSAYLRTLGAEAGSASASIHGVCGSAWNDYRRKTRGSASFESVLRQRFDLRAPSHPASGLRDSEYFEDFVTAKAKELVDRQED